MQYLAFTSGPVATNSFVAFDEENHAVIIDAPPGSFAAVSAAIGEHQLGVGALVLTHSHWDHTADLNRFREEYGSEMIVYGHADDEYRLEKPNDYLGFPIDLTFEPMTTDRHLVHGDHLTIGTMTWSIIHAPGHTEGSICLYDEVNRIIVAGDVLFADSIGRTDLHGGDHDTLIASIHDHLMPLPDDTVVLPGHGPQTTIGREREANPFIES